MDDLHVEEFRHFPSNRSCNKNSRINQKIQVFITGKIETEKILTKSCGGIIGKSSRFVVLIGYKVVDVHAVSFHRAQIRFN